MNYWRIDSDLLLAGFVLQDSTFSTPARSKRLREAGPQAVHRSLLTETVKNYRTLAAANQAGHSRRVADQEDDVLDSEQFKVQYLKVLQVDILRGLSFVHDYKQINAQISQNINVVLEERYTGATIEEKLAQATRAEKAIYAASKFLEEKLNVAKFLLNPEWLLLASECTRFRVHGLVLKYLRIYQSWFDAKRIRVSMTGESRAEVIANPQASGVIAHTFLDNALKYAPSGSSVEIYLEDTAQGVLVETTSLGPKIENSELKKIFRPFYRGRAAIRSAEEGAGYGLYLSQLVAKQHLGTSITVEQESMPEPPGSDTWPTTFGVLFPTSAKVC